MRHKSRTRSIMALSFAAYENAYYDDTWVCTKHADCSAK